MKVHFVLPTPGTEPVGGYKVVYEYANGLAALGHQVVITHAFELLARDLLKLLNPRRWLTYLRSLLTGSYKPHGWFNLHGLVKLRLVPCLHPMFMPKADVIVATAWQTAEWVAQCGPEAGHPFYLIQHLEDWSGDKERVLRTWKLPLHKIVIARWLQDIARELGEKSTYITNGLDFNAFGLDKAIEERPPSVGMLFHSASWKGSEVGLKAIEQLRGIHPELDVVLFGVPPPPDDLPKWIEYARLPSQQELRAIYNRVSLFLAPSLTEGWGLPPAEAMMCGAAVVMTDIGGHHEFGVNEKNCLMVPPGDAAALAAAAARLLRDEELRARLARAGKESIAQFTWSRATALFEKTLQAPLAESP